MYATDELFAAKENLIKPEPPVFAAGEFGAKGKIYDGWESRRRREPGNDHAIIRLGVPGIVHGVAVDTSFFRGNYPPHVSVEAVSVEGYPSAAELARWTGSRSSGAPRRPVTPRNWYPVADRRSTARTCGCRFTQTAAWRVAGCTASRCPIRAS